MSIAEYQKFPSYVLKLKNITRNTTTSSVYIVKNMSVLGAELVTWTLVKTVRR